MAISAQTAPVLSKSSGNVQSNVNNLRTLKTTATSEAASMGDNLQSQINNIVNALMNPGQVTSFSVYDVKGSLIGWIGSQVVGNVSYEGAWFSDLYIGGTGPANAVISATNGGVTIVNAPIKLTSNGLETDINNETLPAWGSGVSLVSIDTSVSNGDQSFIAPEGIGIFAWNSGGSDYVSIATMGDAGSGQGFFQLNGIGNSDQIAMNINPALLALTDGSHTTSIGPSEIITPLINARSYQAAGTPGITASLTALTSVTGNGTLINYGNSLTVNSSSTGVFGTPGTGQTNGNVVTGVTLNTTIVGVLQSLTPASVSHTWTDGILTT